MPPPYRYQSKEPARALPIAVAIVLAALAAWMLFSPHGGWKYYQVSRDLRAIRAENKGLHQANEELRQEIHRLKNDPKYLEEVARQDFDLLRKNEMIFDFSRESRKNRKR